MKNVHTYKFLMRILIFIFAGLCCMQVFAQTPEYHIGDLYTSSDGTQGIVFYLKPEGGGWIVALNDRNSSGKRWGNNTNILTPVTNPSQFGSQSDGYSNTATLRTAFSPDYAANVVDFDRGWYLPSEEQLSILFASLSEIYTRFGQHNGVVPQNTYWSSTPYDNTQAWAMNFRTGERFKNSKNVHYAVREIRDFTCDVPVLVDSTLSFEWNTHETTWNIEVHPEVSSLYYVVVTNQEGDKDTAFCSLLVHPTYSLDEYVTTCDSYEWQHSTHTQSGTYTYYGHTNNYGCDSIINLHLTINYSDTTHIQIDTCNSYQWNGEVYDNSGVYEQNFQTVHGCDSTVYLHLTIYPDYFEREQINICTGQLPYTWRDTIFEIGTVSQVDTFYKQSIYGCDSIVVLQLNVYQEDTHYDTVVTCGSYNIQDTVIYDTGDYEFHYDIPGANCDSVVQLRLIVNSVQEVTIIDTACDVYYWKGTRYTETGEYEYHETNQSGCDSVLHLKLFVKHHIEEHFRGEVCKGDDYIDMENGFVITHTDTMPTGCNDIEFNSGQSSFGCDSIRVLHLSVYGREVFIQSTKDTICIDEQDSVTLSIEGDNYGYVIPTSCPEPIVAIGDILCTDGSIIRPANFVSSGHTAKAVVFFVDESGIHGWAVALDESITNKQWISTSRIIGPLCASIRCALKDTCGYRHTRAMLDSAAVNNLTLPVLDNIDISEGWYLPAAGQLRELMANCHIVNNSIDSLSNNNYMKISITSTNRYWSSTENTISKAYTVSPYGEISAKSKPGSGNGRPRFICSF